MLTRPKYLSILKLLNACTKEELYRFQVDGNLLAKENGWMKYQNREPGCISSFFNAFAYAITNLENKNLSLDFICELYKLCTDGVENIKRYTPSIRENEKNRAFFGLDKDNTTIEGLFDLLKFIREQKITKYEGALITFGKPTGPQQPEIFLSKEQSQYSDEALVKAIYNGLYSNKIYFIAPQGGKSLQLTLNEIIANFNKKIGSKRGDDALNFIVETIYQIYHEHPFSDANLRTLALLLMNRLLIQQGFLPVIFDDPNYFDGNSINQLVKEVKKGMENTQKLLNGTRKLHGFDTSTIDHDSNLLMIQLVKAFSDQINAEVQRLDDKNNIPVDSIKFFSQNIQKMKREQANIEDALKPTVGSKISFCV